MTRKEKEIIKRGLIPFYLAYISGYTNKL